MDEPVQELSETDQLRLEIRNLREQLENLQSQYDDIEQENLYLQSRIYNYENVSKKENFFRKATGIHVEKFDALLKFIDPGEGSSNIKMYDTSKRLSEETYTVTGRKPRLDPREQFFLYLTWLKNGFHLEHTSWLFGIPKSTVSRYIITWSNLCYFSLGSLAAWPTREQINEKMPDRFKRTYPTTRCIIDCTELYCQRPSSLATQSSLYSHYKAHVTYKGLVGITPDGTISFISSLFDGSISDKAIVKQSGFLQKAFWDSGDSVMADRGFQIQEYLDPFQVKLNIPAFLSGREQLTAAEIKESQTIAHVRIHVERAIQRIKKFKILRNEIPLTLHGSVNQIWTVCCIFCNYMPPLIQKTNQID